MIVWVASYPRSGNTFLRAVLHGLHGQTSVSSYAGETRRLDRIRPAFAFAEPLRAPLEALQADPGNFFVKTHAQTPPLPGKALYMVRDGRDVLLSYAWYRLRVQQRRPLASIDEGTLREELAARIDETRLPFGSWSGNVGAWLNRPDTAVLRFEELIRKPELVTGALRGLGLDLPRVPGGRTPSFEELHALRPAFFRSGRVGAWRDEFPPELLPRFQELHGAMMDTLGYA